jgi:hypothetical protein
VGILGLFFPQDFQTKGLAEKVILNKLGNHFANLST